MSLLSSLAIIVACLAAVPSPVCQNSQEDTLSFWRLSLKESMVSAYDRSGAVGASDQIPRAELSRFRGVADAVRTMSGVQIKDYGGVGGLKTVNVRSLGSEHTSVFIDGIQIDNAQNMQVDLGRFSTDNLAYVDLYGSGRSSVLQTAREFASGASLYMTSARPSFASGKSTNLSARLRAGSFGTVNPSVQAEHQMRGGESLRTNVELMRHDGRYKFHRRDYVQNPDGSYSGYDTVMVRHNADLKSLRLESQLFSSPEASEVWDVKAYIYASDRGLPGPVIRRLRQTTADRQTDLNLFLQGKYRSELGSSDRLSLLLGSKISYDDLHYWTNPAVDPYSMPYDNTYRQSSAYVSASLGAKVTDRLKVGIATDHQYSYLDSDLKGFVYPGRYSVWTALSMCWEAESVRVDADLVYLYAADRFSRGSSAVAGAFARQESRRHALTPHAGVLWKVTGNLQAGASLKRFYRMPSFNDLYYTLVGNVALRPESVWQSDMNIQYKAVYGRGWSLLSRMELYYNHVTDKIIATPTANQFRWSMYNIGNVHALGSEMKVSLSKSISEDASFGIVGRYSFQDARDFSNPDRPTYRNQIPYVSRHSGSVSADATYRSWSTCINYTVTGRRWSTSANIDDYLIRPWETCDLVLSRDIGWQDRSVTVRLELNNLLGQQYELVQSYPMPGFNWMLGASVLF